MPQLTMYQRENYSCMFGGIIVVSNECYGIVYCEMYKIHCSVMFLYTCSRNKRNSNSFKKNTTTGAWMQLGEQFCRIWGCQLLSRVQIRIMAWCSLLIAVAVLVGPFWVMVGSLVDDLMLCYQSGRTRPSGRYYIPKYIIISNRAEGEGPGEGGGYSYRKGGGGADRNIRPEPVFVNV